MSTAKVAIYDDSEVCVFYGKKIPVGIKCPDAWFTTFVNLLYYRDNEFCCTSWFMKLREHCCQRLRNQYEI